MIISQGATAMAAGLTTGFLGIGGTAPYTYSVLAGGAGGSINASTGVYTAPAVVNPNPLQSSDVVTVRDNIGAVAHTSILITTALGLFCDIIQNQMGLANGRVFFWDQKIMQPTDYDLYIAVSVLNCKPFGNVTEFQSNGTALQFCATMATLGVDIISRGPAARDRKEEVVMALNSVYAEQQMEANSFLIGRTPPAFVNLSQIDGAAIPYRFNISVNMQYTVTKTVSVPYIDSFDQPAVTTNP